jgi:hypothetical protein
MFGNSIDMHKAYFDREGNLGANYSVHEQLAENLLGQIIKVDRTMDYDNLKVKVYATRKDGNYFIFILNKDVKSAHTIEVNLPNRLNITMRIPQRSYTSIIIDDSRLFISGMGN